MTRMRMTGFEECRWALPILFLVIAMLAGCGEQDLYKPPDSPYELVGRVPLPSGPEDVAVLGDYAYVAGGELGLATVDISDPGNPVLVSEIDTKKFAESVRAASTPTTTGATDIAFVVEGTEGITTYNISQPDSVFSFQQGTTAVDGNGMFLELPANPADPYIVYLAENWHGIRIFESDPSTPGLLRYNGVFAPTRGYAKSIAVANGWAYVADDEMGLAVMDVRVRTLGVVKLVSATDTPGKSLGVAIAVDPATRNGYAYIADGLNGLVIMAIREGDTPVIVGALGLAGTCRAIMVRDGTAFIAAQDGGVHTVDIRDPENPVLTGTVITTYATGIGLASNGTVAVSDRVEGLLLFAGGEAFVDRTAPAAVGDLAAAPIDSSSVMVHWTSPGNDLYTGTAASYDVRYATTAITNDTWAVATPCDGEPLPERSGTRQELEVTGLRSGTEYHFAMKTSDAAGNISALSNVATITTPTGNVPPTLRDGAVSPSTGFPNSTIFVFTVTYADGDGDVPSEARLTVGSESFPMQFVSGDYRSGALYRYETTRPNGSYSHSFHFNDGNGHSVETGELGGPYVGESFAMGSPNDEPGRDPDETSHTVVLTGSIEVSDHEVTQAEYQALMGTNPSRFVGTQRPVENVTWYDAIAYCNARSQQEGKTPAYTINGLSVAWNHEADGWRLPTEAEWERACRAEATTAFANGPLVEVSCVDTLGLPDPSLNAIGWYCGNSGNATHEVKSKVANVGGLYDMHGNVWEWCWDWYGELGSQVVVDPEGPPTGAQRVRRGGSWYNWAQYCRSASRDAFYPTSKDDVLGFRVVRTIR
jgi:formylglycine-generating enzyme required for sulfatase activity